MRDLQLCFAEQRIGQVSSTQGGTEQLGVRQVCANQAGIVQIGTQEVGEAKGGARKLSPDYSRR